MHMKAEMYPEAVSSTNDRLMVGFTFLQSGFIFLN